MIHLSREKYRLELHWDRVEHQSDGVSRLDGAYLSGPVLNLGVVIQAPDNIDLDFTPQHSKIVSSFHIARLSWLSIDKVSFPAAENSAARERILLKNAIITTNYENEISSLSNKDYIIIDTSKHDEKKIIRKTRNNIEVRLPLVYEAYIVKATGEDKYA